jgi:signal transduction histidine kinase
MRPAANRASVVRVERTVVDGSGARHGKETGAGDIGTPPPGAGSRRVALRPRASPRAQVPRPAAGAPVPPLPELRGGTTTKRTPACLVAVLALTAGVGLACVWPVLDAYPFLVVTPLVLGFLLATAGCVLWTERDHRSLALALIAAGLIWPIGWTDVWGGGPFPLASTFATRVATVVSVWAMYRYPDARLVRRPDRLFLVALAGWTLVGRLGLVLMSEPEWWNCASAGPCPVDSWWPTLHGDHALFLAALPVYAVGEALLGITFALLWFRRSRRATGLDRRLMLPVATAAVLAGILGTTPAFADLLGLSKPLFAVLFAVQSVALIVVPCAYLVAVLRRRLAGNAIGRLIQDLDRHHLDRGAAREAVEEALRVVFCDPGLRVRPAGAGAPSPGAGTASAEVDAALLVIPVTSSTGEPLADIEADPSIGHHPDLMDSAVAATRFALENERLHHTLRLQVEQVQASRLRIVDAALAERRNLERDLHDGAQQRLLAIKLRLAATHQGHDHGPIPPEIGSVLAEARDQIGQALDELRDLARGLHPPVLSQSGIAAAVEGIAENHPLPVIVDLPAGRFPAPIEATAYFVVCEALTNVAHHAEATQVLVEGRHVDGHLVVEIIDDGRGGADASGHGLTGLQDRVRAIGGEITITSPAGRGTRLSARIPCP